MSQRRLILEHLTLAALGSVLLAFLAIPLLALLVTTAGPDFLTGIRHPLVWPALRLSFFTTAVSLLTVVVLGAPLAWCLAGARGRLARILEILVQLPIVIPPAVAGVALLLAFGRRSVLARWFFPAEWAPSFSTAAVILAEVFVSAPFFVQAALSAFRRIDPKLLLVARSFGASPGRIFLRVAVPLTAPALAAGAAMSWARSLGEFGATLMFAGNLQAETQTLPLAIYTALEADLRSAQALSAVLVVVAFAVLLFVRGTLKLSERAENGP